MPVDAVVGANWEDEGKGKMTDRLAAEAGFSAVNFYRKESFSKVAAPEVIAEIVSNNDVVLTAIGD